MYLAHGVIGTDKPILREKEKDHFTWEELLHLEERIEDYVHYGFVQKVMQQQVFFLPIYAKEPIKTDPSKVYYLSSRPK
ncbi:hypothetical protein K7887_21945 (plasmid) [Sutcliffiella horikoshii]|uniref:hypothetical protein n=1 Tax=Sutcliffiella horikoshii TaxID=79883 RepID=UPI001CBCFC1D|nr:hypothetical protein [Sutcliffiella horikoshii]UAL49712.1 hypothetical protein K7887_21945 [Sutcliffiella horikoshii]